MREINETAMLESIEWLASGAEEEGREKDTSFVLSLN